MKFTITNENDKNNCFKAFESTIENAIWRELINGQHDCLEIEVNITTVDGESEDNR